MPKNIPTEMYISKNAIAENPEHLTAAKRVYRDRKARSEGIRCASDVTAVLDGAGIPYSVFDGVTENPSVGSAYRAGTEAPRLRRGYRDRHRRGQRDRCCKRRSRRLQKMNLHSPRIYSILRYA